MNLNFPDTSSCQIHVRENIFSLESHTFFLYLLPPVIFEAGEFKGSSLENSGYFMPNRALFENIYSVLLFAVIGTIWNTMAIGMILLFRLENQFRILPASVPALQFLHSSL